MLFNFVQNWFSFGRLTVAAQWSALIMAMVVVSGGACAAEKGTSSPKSKPAAKNQNTVAAPASADSWPLFRGDPLATGVAKGALPQQPEVVWKHRIDGGSFEATAVIADGTIFIGDFDGTVLALDLATGDVKWTYQTEIGISAAAAVRDGLVYVGDIEGRFYCLDAKSGKPAWQIKDPESGETLPFFAAGAEINGGPNFHGENVLFGSQDATLYCLDAKTGEVVWKHTIDDQIRCAPTIVEGRAFLAGCDGKLHIIDVTKGEAVDSVPIESPTGSTPAALGDHVYFGTEAGEFFNIDWRKAEVVWKYHGPQKSLSIRSSAAVTEDLVVFGGRDKLVHGVDPKTGEARWTFPTRRRIDSSPVVVGNRVFIGSSDGKLYALDRKTGKEVWSYEAGGEFVASPAVAAGKLIIGNTDGTLYCFGAK